MAVRYKSEVGKHCLYHSDCVAVLRLGVVCCFGAEQFSERRRTENDELGLREAEEAAEN